MTPIDQLLTQVFSPTVFPMVMVGTILAVAAAYGGVAAWRWIVAGDLISKGVKLEGRIFSKQKEEHRQSRSWRVYYIYFVTYVYDYEGVPYEHTQNVSGRHYNRFEKGQVVAMACMPNDPNVAQLIGPDADSSRITRPAGTALIVLLMALFMGVAYGLHWFKK